MRSMVGPPPIASGGEWMPIEPDTLGAAGLTDGEVEALILKTLNGRAEATGRYSVRPPQAAVSDASTRCCTR